MSLDQAKVAELVETARASWLEHHRLRLVCQKAFAEADRLQAEMEGALQKARHAEADLSNLLRRAALEEVRVDHPEANLSEEGNAAPVHPETARPELTGLLGDAFQRGQDGYRPKSNDEGK